MLVNSGCNEVPDQPLPVVERAQKGDSSLRNLLC